MIAIIKNRKEKGIREWLFGSNPHSKGDIFSRSTIVFFDNKEARNITIVEIIKINVPIKVVKKITYTKFI
jgi:hypothetical protein